MAQPTEPQKQQGVGATPKDAQDAIVTDGRAATSQDKKLPTSIRELLIHILNDIQLLRFAFLLALLVFAGYTALRVIGYDVLPPIASWVKVNISSTPKIAGLWEYRCIAKIGTFEHGGFQHGGIVTIKQTLGSFENGLELVGKRLWKKERDANGKETLIPFDQQSIAKWKGKGAFTGTDSFMFEYEASSEIGLNLQGFAEGNIVVHDASPDAITGTFFATPGKKVSKDPAGSTYSIYSEASSKATTYLLFTWGDMELRSMKNVSDLQWNR